MESLHKFILTGEKAWTDRQTECHMEPIVVDFTLASYVMENIKCEA